MDVADEDDKHCGVPAKYPSVHQPQMTATGFLRVDQGNLRSRGSEYFCPPGVCEETNDTGKKAGKENNHAHSNAETPF